MSQKKESETIKQQKKAREEFIKLKKMQSGEIEAGPKPSDVAIVPKTFKEKIENIWYHFGKFIIISVFLIIALTVMIVQCANRIEYDLEIVYFTYTAVPDTVTGQMAKYFEKYADDVNGDGKVNVSVINCSCNPNDNNSAKLTKMQAMIVSEPKAMLYITDSQSITYFDKISGDNVTFFNDKKYDLSEEFYNECTSDFNIQKDLKICIRNVTNTQIEKDKDTSKYHKASENLIKKLK